MVDQDWIRGRACQKCYTQKLKCRRLPGNATCVRCARLHAQCRPRPPKDRCDGEHTLRLSSPHSANPWPRKSSVEHSMSSEPNSTISFTLSTPGSSLADVSRRSGEPSLAASDTDLGWQAPFLQPTIPASAMITTGMTATALATLPVSLDAEMGSTDSEQMHLHRWVNDVAHLNSSICALQQQTDLVHNLSLPAKTELETIFQMALDFSALVATLHIEQSRSATGQTHSQRVEEPGCASTSTNAMQMELQIEQILTDPSNVLLLTSVYGRLLGLLQVMLDHSGTQSTPPQLGLKIGLVDFGDKPVMQSLIIVNVIELLIRRMDQILGLSNADADTTAPQYPCFFAGRCQHEDRSKGLAMVLDMTRKQQNDLLEAASSLRAHLLHSSCW